MALVESLLHRIRYIPQPEAQERYLAGAVGVVLEQAHGRIQRMLQQADVFRDITGYSWLPRVSNVVVLLTLWVTKVELMPVCVPLCRVYGCDCSCPGLNKHLSEPKHEHAVCIYRHLFIECGLRPSKVPKQRYSAGLLLLPLVVAKSKTQALYRCFDRYDDRVLLSTRGPPPGFMMLTPFLRFCDAFFFARCMGSICGWAYYNLVPPPP